MTMQAAVELCWLTCASSELNGEELTRSGGVDILGSLLARCCAIMPKDVAPNQPAAIITTHALRTLAGMAAFSNAQGELVSRCVPSALPHRPCKQLCKYTNCKFVSNAEYPLGVS